MRPSRDPGARSEALLLGLIVVFAISLTIESCVDRAAAWAEHHAILVTPESP